MIRPRSIWGPYPPTPRQWLLLALTLISVAYAGGTNWDPPASWAAPDYVPSFFPQSFGDLLERLQAGLPFCLWIMAILGSHEMGHYIACRLHRVPATWPYFLPAPFIFMFGTFGAVIRIRAPFNTRRALFDVAIAGPIAGFVVTLIALAVGLWTATGVPEESFFEDGGGGILFGLPWIADLMAEWLRPGESLQMNGTLGAAWAGLLVTTLNLFPAGQLDGGHLVFALSERWHRRLSVVALLIAIGSVEYALWRGQVPTYAVWVIVLAWMRDRHPPLPYDAEPLGPGRRLLFWIAAAIFILSFHWLPIEIVAPS